MEAVIVMFLLVISVELALILTKPEKNEKVEKVVKSRRDIEGTFSNPLGDSYRRNTKKQYVPIIPNSKMLDGDEEDEV